MAKGVKKQTSKIERALILYGALLFFVFIVLIIISFVFMSENMLSAFSGGKVGQAAPATYDLNGAKKLGL